MASEFGTISEDDLNEEGEDEDDMAEYDDEDRPDIEEGYQDNNGFERSIDERSRLPSVPAQQHLNMTHHREIEVEEHFGETISRLAHNQVLPLNIVAPPVPLLVH